MYRPNFCADCGRKIIRLRWHAWTSRSFCTACARTLQRAQILRLILAAAVLFTAGILLGHMRRPVQPPLIIERSESSPLLTGSTSRVTSSSGNPTNPIVEEDVYICGARTKKGTPCSRRVHGPVRCWQHKGMNAMLPLEKLKVKS